MGQKERPLDNNKISSFIKSVPLRLRIRVGVTTSDCDCARCVGASGSAGGASGPDRFLTAEDLHPQRSEDNRMSRFYSVHLPYWAQCLSHKK